MKKQITKFFTILLAALMLMPLSNINAYAEIAGSEIVRAEEGKDNGELNKIVITEPTPNPQYQDYLDHPENYKYGYIPEKYLFPKVVDGSKKGRRKRETRFYRASPIFDIEPKIFDARDHKWITPVKDQHKTGTCWAHSSLSTIETLLLKNAKGEVNLSEGHMAFNRLENPGLENGGNNLTALHYFSRLAGPLKEENAVEYIINKDSNDDTFKSKGLNVNADTYSKKHDFFIPNMIAMECTVDNIKKCVKEYGSVSCGYYDDNGEENAFGYQINKKTQKQEEQHIYTYNKIDCYHRVKTQELRYTDGRVERQKITNHQVTIVGWDDTKEITNKYKEVYKEEEKEKDPDRAHNEKTVRGAFLVKNSWGTKGIGEKEDGYMWISYDSFIVGAQNDPLFVFTDAEDKKENVSNVYYYMTSDKEYGQSGLNGSTFDAINVFNRNTTEKECLTDVSFFYFDTKSISYKIFLTEDIEPNGDYLNADRDKWIEIANGRLDKQGYHTISVGKKLLSKDKYAIILETDANSILTFNKNASVKSYYNESKNSFKNIGKNFAIGAITSKEDVIVDKKVDIPSPNNDLIYNGAEQIGVEEKEGYALVNNKGTDAGKYIATATLKEGYKWSDASKESKTIKWEIKKADPKVKDQILSGIMGEKLSSITLPSGYSWKNPETVMNNNIQMDYPAVFTPEDTKNYNIVDKDLEVFVKKKIKIPVANKGLVYNEKEQIGVNEGEGYKLEGNTGKNAAIYEASAWPILVNNDGSDHFFIWEDGTNEIKIIKWEIACADYGEIELPKNLSGIKGQTLNEVVLPSGFKWCKKNQKLDKLGEHEFEAFYDLGGINYKTKLLKLKVNVVEDDLDKTKKEQKEKEEAAKKEAEEKKLQEAKDSAIEKINAFSYLTDADKGKFIEEISDKTDKQSIDEVVTRAEEENRKKEAEVLSLKELKNQKNGEIDALINLEKDAKDEYKKSITDASNKDEVLRIFEEAKATDQKTELGKVKNKVKEEIGKLEKLSNDQKNEFYNRIENAEKTSDLDAILNDAKDLNQKIIDEEIKKADELKAANKKALAEISGLEYLENKEEYTKQITEATEISKVNEILAKAKEENNKAKAAKEKEELDKAKNAASLEVSSFNDLGDAKDAYKGKILEAQNKSEVETILVEARAKNSAIIEVKNLEKLDDIKSVYIEKIIEAENKEKVEEIKDEAKAKEVAIEKVEKLDKLKKEDKDKLIKEIKKAESTEAAEKIVKEAEKKVNPKLKDDPKPGKEEVNPVNPEKPNKDRPKDKEPQIIIPSRRDNDFRISHSHSKTYPVKTGAIIMAKENSKESPQNVIDNKLEKKAEDKIVYKDIKGHWAERQINYALEQNYFKDIVKGNDFKPNEKITRAEFVTILGRRAGIDPSTFELKHFKDVDGKKYYSPYIAWALENKIVFGIDEDTFAPDKEMTREEMAAFLVRFEDLINLNLKEEKEGKNFKDAKEISTWAKDSVEKLSKLNIIEGMGDGKFSPKTNLTRAQIASVIDKIK